MTTRRVYADTVRPALARLQALVEGVSPEAIAAADKKAAASVVRRFGVAARRVVRETYNVKNKHLMGKFSIEKGDMKAAGMRYSLLASTYKTPLSEFGGRWGGRRTKGATAAISKGEGRKVYHSAFIARVNGQEWMLVRQFSRDSHLASGRDPRNKLKRLSGPSPYQMFVGKDRTNAMRISAELNEFRTTEIVRLLRLARQGKL